MRPAILPGVNTLRGLFGAVLMALGSGAALVGFAAPAHATQQLLEGVYTYQQDGLPDAQWSIYPVCVPVVGDLRAEIRDPVACTLTVSSAPIVVAKGGAAKLVGDRWTYNVSTADGLSCPDGSTAALNETFEFDANTLSGTRTVSHGQVCGLPATLQNTPFTLVFREPLPIPVNEYPLICEPGGLRRCF